MEQLADELGQQGFRFVFIYVREAHPGEHYPHHTSFEQKLAHARAFRERCGVRRTILVDDLAGTMPNMAYVISRLGALTFKSNWTDAETIRFALQYQMRMAELRREGMRLAPFYVEMQGLRWNDPARFQEGLALAGPKAVAEFAAAFERRQRDGRRPG